MTGLTRFADTCWFLPGIPISPPSSEEPASLLQLVVQPWLFFSDTSTAPEDPVKLPNMSMHPLQLVL